MHWSQLGGGCFRRDGDGDGSGVSRAAIIGRVAVIGRVAISASGAINRHSR